MAEQAIGCLEVGGDDHGLRREEGAVVKLGSLIADGGHAGVQPDGGGGQCGGQLLGNHRHALCGDRGVTPGEIAHHEFQLANCGIEPVFEEHATEEGPEEALDHRFGKALGLKSLQGC